MKRSCLIDIFKVQQNDSATYSSKFYCDFKMKESKNSLQPLGERVINPLSF